VLLNEAPEKEGLTTTNESGRKADLDKFEKHFDLFD
jgi:hypothetical protein